MSPNSSGCSVERFREYCSSVRPATSKRVYRIAATDNPAAILAPDLIPRFKSQAPNAKVAFTVPDKPRIVEHLEQGDIDLFIGAAEDVRVA
ncbi:MULTISPECIES: LysR substrate-binding domain-containing protein [unclassified Mesorhizobium]|uniref:LysR substrate-binding domain-containing protein n=2 Tax=Mesorhizobium TaxID=68287 RepID=UPI001FDF9BF4|nr:MULTISPECIES: LysR substrate-binding domain-containing protein [unclassified Mesorhizobium]